MISLTQLWGPLIDLFATNIVRITLVHIFCEGNLHVPSTEDNGRFGRVLSIGYHTKQSERKCFGESVQIDLGGLKEVQ